MAGLHNLVELRREPSTIPGAHNPHRYSAVCSCGDVLGPCSSSVDSRARKLATELHDWHWEHFLKEAPRDGNQ